MEIMNGLYRVVNRFYDYLFPPVDIDWKLKECRKNFSEREMRLYAREITHQDFKNELLKVVGRQEEDRAVDMIIKAYAIVLMHPEYLENDVDIQELLNFRSPMPEHSLANGRSIEHISRILDMDKLHSIIQSILKKQTKIWKTQYEE